MRVRERVAGLEDPAHDARRRLGALALQLASEVAAFQILHDEVGLASVEAAKIEDAAHVLALDLRRRAPLAEEALGATLRALAEEKLDRHALVELEVPRRDDDAHASAPEHALDTVFTAEGLAGQDGSY